MKTYKFDAIFNLNILRWRHLAAQRQIRTHPTVSKPFPYSNILMAKWHSQFILFKTATDQKIERFRHQVAREVRPYNDRELRTVLYL